MSKSTAVEVETRVGEIAELLIAGSPRKEIVRYSAKWDISPRQVDTYISKAKETLGEIGRELATRAHGVAAARLERLYRKAIARVADPQSTVQVEAAYMKIALDVVKEHNRLHGLAGERRILEGDPTRPVYITPGQLPEEEWAEKYKLGAGPKPVDE